MESRDGKLAMVYEEATLAREYIVCRIGGEECVFCVLRGEAVRCRVGCRYCR